MNNNVLIVCNTVLQIMFSVNLKQSFFQDDNVSLMISDDIHDAYRLVKNSQQLKVFNHVSFLQKKKFFQGEKESTPYIITEIERMIRIAKILNLKERYDILLTANSDVFTQYMYSFMKKKSPKLRYFMYEDGLSAYCVLGERLKKQRHSRASAIHCLFDKVFKNVKAYNAIEGAYFFEPDLVQWDDDIPFIQVPKFTIKREETISILNIIFDYANLEDTYYQKYVFFEESYFAEGTNVDDVSLVKMISDYVGKDNLKIKIHPRNPVNRFKELGYFTNTNTTVPWELIMINMKNTETVLLTIASGSVANPFLLFGMKYKSVILLNCTNGDFQEHGRIYNDFLMRHVYEKNPGIFFVPQSEDEMIDWLKQENNNG